jgi:hypothetical protein
MPRTALSSELFVGVAQDEDDDDPTQLKYHLTKDGTSCLNNRHLLPSNFIGLIF